LSNLVVEILLRFVKPLAALVLGAIVYIVAVAAGEPATIPLALLSWISAAAFILLAQEGVI
jgi:hypothetical protein